MAVLVKLPSVFPSVDASPSQATFELDFSLILLFFSLSLAENILVTGLIVSKILTVYRDIKRLESHVGHANGLASGRDIVPIISIVIESGLITFVVQLVQVLMFKLDGIAYPLIGRPVVMLYVRGFYCQILV